ncbi:MAG: CDP-alcohol phosphatidyltransferase family protein [Gemmataceae bacterium]
MATNPDRLWTIPNVLTLSRLPLAVVLFACISHNWWLAGLLVFGLAAITDWLDGLLARYLDQQSAIGRSLDPLIDKVLTGGAFIYLMPVKDAELMPWMVTVVVGRELLITGIRGIMEAQGMKFGADWLGKIKMVLQCAVLVAVLLVLWLRTLELSADTVAALHGAQVVLIYTMVAATILSGVKYVAKAARDWTRG